MGLRLKIIVTLMAILAGMAALSVWVVREQQLDDSLRQERVEVDKDLRRLLLALDAQLAQFDVVLGSWSNFSAMYEHAAQPNEGFRRDELNAASLQASYIDWLFLLDGAGELREQVEQIEFMPAQRAALLAEIRARLGKGEAGCGVSLLARHFALVCYRPLLRSDRSGPARGTVVVGRWFSNAMFDSVQRQTRLEFVLLPGLPPPAAGVPGEAAEAIEAVFTQGRPSLSVQGRELAVDLPVIGLSGAPVGLLRMAWERSSLERLAQSQTYVTRGLVLLILLTGAAMLVVVDRLVVRRLRRLELDLRSVVDSNRWTGELEVSGHDEIGRLAQYANGMIQVVRHQMVELTLQSTTDVLTGLPNRRKFDERLALAMANQQRHGRPCALVLIDVDFFKRYNDSYGHPAGDLALQMVARCLQAVARRPGDLAARLGGEEFALLLEETEPAGALARASAACAAVQAQALPHQASAAATVLTISCGLASMRSGESAELLYSRADQALYRAKEAGRNRVAVAE
jgi:diguanylate cyclase (GGDEF)-like protein